MAPTFAERSQTQSPAGARLVAEPTNVVDFPFGVPGDLSSVHGSVYGPSQLLVQQSAYAISKALFTYSPEGFYLDNAVSTWHKFQQPNGAGVVPRVAQLQSRAGAGSALLGFVYNLPQADKPSPLAVLASSGTLEYMQPVLAQYAVKPSAASPIAFNIAAVSFKGDRLVSDYATPMNVAKNLGLGLVASSGASDAQAVSLLTAVLSSVVPTIHTYDGIQGVRKSAKSTNVHGVTELEQAYSTISKDLVEFSASKLPLAQKITALIDRVNTQLNTNIKAFDYSGHQEAETVAVVFGSKESQVASAAAEKLSKAGNKVGTVNVRLYSPFLENEFFQALPKTVKRVVVLGQALDGETSSTLYSDVVSALYMKYGLGGNMPEVVDHKYSSEVFTVNDIASDIFGQSIDKEVAADTTDIVFLDSDNASTKAVAGTLAHTLSLDRDNSVSYVSKYINQTLTGVVEAQVRVSKGSDSGSLDIQEADVVFVSDPKVFTAYNVISRVKANGVVVVPSRHSVADVEKVVGPSFIYALSSKQVKVFALDFDAIGENPETRGRTRSIVQQIAFWKTSPLGAQLSLDQVTTKIVLSNGNDTELVAATIANLIDKVQAKGLKEIVDLKPSSEAPEESLPSDFILDSFVPNENGLLEGDEDNTPKDGTLVDAAQKVTFSEAYGIKQDLRPDQPTQNFIAKVKVNQRVTPSDYDRHIFHLELDITGTGLKYAIGEALGVHAPNNEQAVREFIEWYGANPDDIVAVPAVEEGYVENKTVYQALRDNLDLFGKPPKKFFESLARHATDMKQRLALGRLAAPTGADDLKRRTEEDTCTYVDILQEFTSAHPPISALVQMVSPLKRREYSIASSQKMHPNEVHLLIVVVDWVDSKGRKRFGQCSKWLADLGTGAEVVVSVKPSVMKLPASPKAPIIMSGLGTGLAPFKAFLEEKAVQKANGEDIGEIYLFLGSRHQRQEYLYGELFEAYKDAGILTYIGAAFSRDQPQKIYIQDRIREAKPHLVNAFVKQNGSFYLCGPTWPVADVSAALSDIVATEAAERGETIDHAATIEDLKEQERYILEVY
uniref:assimilatory sulfite reductase (NADPH) n=1 Tax=Blastobotrys adeninivorans TaxID=409370 RepID=A0A060SZW7_BLAAD